MEKSIDHIKFSPLGSRAFDKELKQRVGEMLSDPSWLRNGRRRLWFKAVFYYTVFLLCLSWFLLIRHDTTFTFILSYISVGVSGVFMAFNVSHDATHGTFSDKKWVNQLVYHLTFNLQGTNAYLWGLRHKASHHVFPNVDGCDADIDDNPVLRLSPTKPLHYYHRFQAYYAPLVYCIYVAHWILFKDWLYFSKKRIGNLRNIKHTWSEFFNVLAWKLIYFTLMLVIPVWYWDYSLSLVVTGFVLNQMAVSLIFVFTLIVSHLTTESEFPMPDANGTLPYSYMEHQLATSLDYAPQNKSVNFLLGGFNSHAAHHLFPHLPHTLYCEISKIIEETAHKYGYPYHVTSLFRAIKAHFGYLKNLGRPEVLAEATPHV